MRTMTPEEKIELEEILSALAKEEKVAPVTFNMQTDKNKNVHVLSEMVVEEDVKFKNENEIILMDLTGLKEYNAMSKDQKKELLSLVESSYQNRYEEFVSEPNEYEKIFSDSLRTESEKNVKQWQKIHNDAEVLAGEKDNANEYDKYFSKLLDTDTQKSKKTNVEEMKPVQPLFNREKANKATQTTQNAKKSFFIRQKTLNISRQEHEIAMQQ